MHPALNASGPYRRDRLLAHSMGHPHAEPLACMVAAQYAGGGATPPDRGLDAAAVDALQAHYFRRASWRANPPVCCKPRPARAGSLLPESGQSVTPVLQAP